MVETLIYTILALTPSACCRFLTRAVLAQTGLQTCRPQSDVDLIATRKTVFHIALTGIGPPYRGDGVSAKRLHRCPVQTCEVLLHHDPHLFRVHSYKSLSPTILVLCMRRLRPLLRSQVVLKVPLAPSPSRRGTHSTTLSMRRLPRSPRTR